MTNAPNGVDLELGDRCSRKAFHWAERSFEGRQGKSGLPLFRGRGSFCNWMDYGAMKMAMTCDGIGTKAELAERTGIYDTLGYDLVAMVADDLVANGIEPVNLVNVLDVDRLDEEIVDSLMKGLYEAAMECRIAIVGGELAELGDRVGGWGPRMHFNWCATAIGMPREGLSPIDGGSIQAGDVVVALRSDGLRSNGFSLARSILAQAFGPLWHEVEYRPPSDLASPEAKFCSPAAQGGRDRPPKECKLPTWGERLLTPSKIYAPSILALIEQDIPLRGVAHITGGGIPSKFRRVLSASGLGARLDHLFEPHPFMRRLVELGGVDFETATRQWNMGNGMLIVLPPEAVERSLAVLAECRVTARVAGEITSAPEIVIEGAPFA